MQGVLAIALQQCQAGGPRLCCEEASSHHHQHQTLPAGILELKVGGRGGAKLQYLFRQFREASRLFKDQ